MNISIYSKSERYTEVPGEKSEPLNLLTKDELRDAARRLNPKITDDEFNLCWEEFQARKIMKGVN